MKLRYLNALLAIDIYQWFREVCSTKLVNEAWLNPNSVILGGPGIIMQIDESMFSHKPKVIT